MAVLVVFLLFLLAEPAISQLNDLDNNSNSFLRWFCGRTPPIHPSNFIKNRNSTLAELRRQLLTDGVFYATAQDLSAGDTVYAAAQCRNYLSTDECVACFDAGVSVLFRCVAGDSAYVVVDNCFIRYEDYADFYNNPNVVQDGVGTPFSPCGNTSASQPVTTFEDVVEGILTEIRDATPKASNNYVALTREITSSNETVYAIGQCVGSNKTACETCMNSAYSYLTNCLPTTDGRFFDMACFARYSNTAFFNGSQITDVTNILKGNSTKTIVAGTIAGVALLFFILGIWLLYRRRKKAKETEQANFKGAVNYNYKDLLLATNHFGEENILGKGGFGEVFKATLDDNSIVAVKKLQAEHVRVKEEFENEVKLISHVHHRNLLRLLGWSSEGSELLLVLEYMPNGSLDRFLWGSKRGTLDWNQRYEIIFGIARGLAHLHNEFHVKIIHRDIKSSNILLTDDFKPKIADFGLARFLPEDETHVVTNYAGTLGYTAPEYALRGLLSDKVDTYSFGVVILEIISGRRSTEVKSGLSSAAYLLEQAWQSYEKNIHMKFIDETLNLNQHEQEHVMKIIEIALLCTQTPPSKRPTMSEMVLMLQEGQSLGTRQLTRPTFVQNHDRRVNIVFSKNSSASNHVYKNKMELEADDREKSTCNG
ncbi:hypothetical protein L2E82_34233 [Cichorium intybus]|uniref:Uncharacterized protein n=1 Tax=Cichorium intybus TaxID=13427 RepID=A0ACB9BLU5_CICIN|nr:hypothetical protein L2E82_34233 [Cichorium intybus]